MTLTISHSDRFPLRSKKHHVGPVQDYDQTDKETATLWTLHLRAPDTLTGTYNLVCKVYGLSAPLTGEYVAGDSFAEWAEPYSEDKAVALDQPGRALHVEFVAPDLDTAISVARKLCQRLGSNYYLDPRNVTLSTGGDWAEQAEVWA